MQSSGGMRLQLLMELQKVALKADDDNGPVRQTLSTFAGELGTIVDKQLQVFLHPCNTCILTYC